MTRTIDERMAALGFKHLEHTDSWMKGRWWVAWKRNRQPWLEISNMGILRATVRTLAEAAEWLEVHHDEA
ncbi:MAG: hypothetical protein LHW45_08040 [Candidatus Cloacimonetes bacterium]|nr:hypothetical protein [Candidatus Cloacimonadota bacterium]MDY0367559.1 hypothetical protein [Candidatus Syntrophosphaera sp.]